MDLVIDDTEIDNTIDEKKDDVISILKNQMRKLDNKKYHSKDISVILHYLSLQTMMVSSFLNDNPSTRKKILSKIKSLYNIQ